MMRGSLVCAGLVVASLAGPRPGLADERATSVAVDLFNEGKEAERHGDDATACSKFAESARVEAKVGTFARLAQCEERRGLTLSARAHWEQASELAASTRDPRAEHARLEFARIDAQVPKLKLVLAGSAPPGLTLTVDGQSLDASALGALLPVTADEHTILAQAPGRRSFAASVRTAANGAVTLVSIDLGEPMSPESKVEPPAAGASAPVRILSPEQPRIDPTPRWNPQRTFALAAGGLGIVAAGVGSYFGLRSFSQWSDAKEQCGGGCLPGSAATMTKSAAQDDATAADIAFGSAGAFLAVACVLWLTAPTDSSVPPRSVRVVPLGGPVTGIAVAGQLGH